MEQLSFLTQRTNSEPKSSTSSLSFWKLFIDGASRNNPGPAGAGVYLLKDNKVVVEKGFYLGEKTNNQAEYLALLVGIYFFEQQNIKPDEPISIYSDSQLLVSQLNGLYRVKNSALKKYFDVAKKRLSNYNHQLHHVLRHKNSDADALANLGIDRSVAIPQGFITMMQSHEIEL